LERLRPAIDVLTVDRSRFLSFVHEVLGRHDPGAAVRVNTIDRQITALSMTFQRLLMAETRFRTDCRLSHMRDLKDAAAALSSDANALDEVMD
ncbi:MAG TPA: hypothetical protein VNR64_05985, partial [Vicinamibacterales bacterium]|nr:hypothetical protein [Vicinamibacterales bacterium]